MSAGPQARLTVERIERLDDYRADWERLAEKTGHPFVSWEWVMAWWRWFAAGRELYSFACRDASGGVVGILPMYVAAVRPVRVARFLGFGDLYSPLAAPEHRPAVAAALHEVLTSRGGPRVLVAEKLPRDAGWGELLGGELLFSHPDPILRLNGLGWKEFLATRSRNFRSNVGRKERKLERDFELAYRLCDDPSRLDDDLDVLFRLHALRWEDETTGVFAGRRAEMHRELAAEALAKGWLRLWLLQLDGEPAAAYYGWRYAGSEWFMQSGRDPRFAEQGVGGVLLANVIRDACNDGVDSFRFLAGDEGYKFRWTEDENPAESRLLGSGPTAKAVAFGVVRAKSLPGPLRKRMLAISR